MTTENDILNVSNLADLAQMVSCCEKCELSKTKNADVFGTGADKARVMFIGEAPGKKEDEIGEPFVGSAGKFLDELLEGVGLKRQDVYIANVLKHRPPENRDPSPEEIEHCWPYLAKQIEIIKPQLIVFLGRHALNRFFPQAKISEVHGQVFEKPWQGHPQRFLALYHPAAALYNGSLRKVLVQDFGQIPVTLKQIEEDSDNSKEKQDKLF